MSLNPLIRRFRYSQLRPWQIWVYLAIYGTIAVLVVLINTVFQYSNQRDPATAFDAAMLATLGQHWYGQFLLLQIMILWFWTAYNTGSAFSAEILRKSYDFFRMLPLSAPQKIWGLIIGRNLAPLLIATLNTAALFACGCGAGYPLAFQFQILAALLAVAAFLNLAALVMSGLTAGKSEHPRSISIIALVFISMGIIPHLLFLSGALGLPDTMRNWTIAFLTLPVPALAMIPALALYGSVWAFLGAVGRFNREGEPLFTRAGAVGFSASLTLLLMGLLGPWTMGTAPHTRVIFWCASFMPLLGVPFGTLKSYDQYLEIFSGHPAGKRSPALVMAGVSNLSLGLALFAVWTVFAAMHGFLSGFQPLFVFHILLMHLSFYLLFLVLLEIAVVFQPINGLISVLVGFILLLHLILPLILGGILNSWEQYVLFSPFGLWYGMFHPEIFRQLNYYVAPLAGNLLLSFLGVALIIFRYRAAMRTPLPPPDTHLQPPTTLDPDSNRSRRAPSPP